MGFVGRVPSGRSRPGGILVPFRVYDCRGTSPLAPAALRGRSLADAARGALAWVLPCNGKTWR